MKKFIPFILIVLLCISCEDVINVDLDKPSTTRLVIDAPIRWIKGTNGNRQIIELSLTAPFFDAEIPAATGAKVIVTDANDNTYDFIEEGDPGLYVNNTFKPELNGEYTLEIVYNNETYRATETLTPVVQIDSVNQRNDVGFAGDEIEVRAYYKDPKNKENFYFFEFFDPKTQIRNNEIYDDEFSDGNTVFASYFNDDFAVGDTLIIGNQGVSKRFFNYLNILVQQTNADVGDPFETQPAIVRGNCVNITNPEHFPLGYFRVSEASAFIYTIE